MIGDGLAHEFCNCSYSFIIKQIPIACIHTISYTFIILILRLNEKAHIHGDAAIGLISSFAVALGVLISSIANGFNVDLFSHLFGSILVISKWICFYP